MKKLFTLLIILGLALLIGYLSLNLKGSKDEKTSEMPTKEEIVTKKPDKLQVTKMYFGDVFWGRYINDWSKASDLKEKYPFSGLSSFERENFQAWIGSLNCPITDKEVPSSLQNDTLMFNCTPNYLTEVKKWFNIFSLANSHTGNQNGLVGFEQTRNYLAESGIQYFGHYNKNITDKICEVVTIPAKAFLNNTDYENVKETNYEIKEFYIPITMCGYHNTFELPTENQLDEIKKYTDIFPTFVYAIQGKEYEIVADELQRSYFRAMIDRGADAVIGKGAHVVQDTESYKGKPIIYSMGNFVFDQQFSANVTQGIGVIVKIDCEYDENLENWQKIAKECVAFKDNCLTEAKRLGLKKPKYTVTYDIVATDNSGRLAKKASPEIQEAMLKRTNWLETLEGLGP